MSSSKLQSLPFELVEEILYRVPIETLARFRTMCKQWYTLFNDKRFIYKSFDLSKDKRFIQVYHRLIHLFKLEPEALLRLRIPVALRNQSFKETIHCDGLLLVLLNESRKVAVWNPFLSRRVKLIKLSSSYTTHEVYGFGYDSVSRDNYKILRIKAPNHTQGEIEIYEFKCNLWRSVDATLGCDLNKWEHVSMNGNMYWIAQAKMVNSGNKIFIQSFDFSTEKFKPICCVPDGTGCYPKKSNQLVLSGFGGDRLSLLHQHNNQKIEVWITNKVSDGIVSWSRFFNVDCPGRRVLHWKVRSSPTYYIHETNKIMLWCEEVLDEIRVFSGVYEMGEGEMNKLVVLRCQGRLCYYIQSSCHVYVPSLVPVPE